MLWLIDGNLATLSPVHRARLIAWQEARTRIALGHLFSLLTVVSTCKVVLILAGTWHTDTPRWRYGVALALVALGRWGYSRARSLIGEGLAATLHLLALLGILMDSTRGWSVSPGLAIGWICLLAALGIPLLARLRSVVVFAGVLVGASALFLSNTKIDAPQRMGVELLMAASIAGGVLLRRLRSDMSLDFRRTAEAAIQDANSDALTGLPNRRGWRLRAPAFLDESAQRGHPISLLFIDLDHFKQLNDVLGHMAGDQALVRMADVLRSHMAGGLAARLGGEEFVCLLPGMDAAVACDFAAALRHALRTRTRPPLTFSGGVAQWRSGESLKDLLARGDSAMYRAKQAGRDRVEADADSAS